MAGMHFFNCNSHILLISIYNTHHVLQHNILLVWLFSEVHASFPQTWIHQQWDQAYEREVILPSVTKQYVDFCATKCMPKWVIGPNSHTLQFTTLTTCASHLLVRIQVSSGALSIPRWIREAHTDQAHMYQTSKPRVSLWWTVPGLSHVSTIPDLYTLGTAWCSPKIPAEGQTQGESTLCTVL
jgi:hypothetical protein